MFMSMLTCGLCFGRFTHVSRIQEGFVQCSLGTQLGPVFCYGHIVCFDHLLAFVLELFPLAGLSHGFYLGSLCGMGHVAVKVARATCSGSRPWGPEGGCVAGAFQSHWFL